MSETQFKLGMQVGALSKAVIADKLDKAEEVLIVRNLDMIPIHGTFNAKFNAVMTYFGAQGTCVLEGVKEFYALSTDKRIVYIRFLTKRAKYTAEAKFKSFKSLTLMSDSMLHVLTSINFLLTFVRAETRFDYIFTSCI